MDGALAAGRATCCCCGAGLPLATFPVDRLFRIELSSRAWTAENSSKPTTTMVSTRVILSLVLVSFTSFFSTSANHPTSLCLSAFYAAVLIAGKIHHSRLNSIRLEHRRLLVHLRREEQHLPFARFLEQLFISILGAVVDDQIFRQPAHGEAVRASAGCLPVLEDDSPGPAAVFTRDAFIEGVEHVDVALFLLCVQGKINIKLAEPLDRAVSQIRRSGRNRVKAHAQLIPVDCGNPCRERSVASCRYR